MDYKVKRLSDYSDESLLNELRKVAKELSKNTLTQKEFNQHARTRAETIVERFGSWNAGLKKAGLSVGRVKNVPKKELIAEIERVWDQLGRQPHAREIARLGKFSVGTYERRFGSWLKALEEFAQWKSKGGDDALKKIKPDILLDPHKESHRTKRVEYGEPIDFLGLRHAPLNEQGVVYLFGMLSKELGFIIEAVRTDFPDCEGKRRIPSKQDRWEGVSIEFEYKSSQFKVHGHNPDECDVIICWEHDWKECPIEVISLKETMKTKRSKEQKE